MSDASQLLVVVTTCDDRQVLEKIAAALIEGHLAACAQISGPITSHYIWKNQRETSEEFLLTLKTLQSRFDEVQQLIESMHAYELPEIMATAVVAASDRYTNWIVSQVR